MGLTTRIESGNDSETVFFSGDIDEDAEVSLGDLQGKLSGACTFHLKEVQSVNSCGVRAWINFMREAEKNTTQITFAECPPEIVSQFNMIPNFKGKAIIQSVYASYSCDNCDAQKLVLFERGKNLPDKLDASLPEVNCPSCSETMEMEDLEEEFFAWVEHS